MLISNETPSITWNIADLVSGSNWQTGAPFSQLTNGKPRIGCRLFRGSTVGGFRLDGTWTTASRPKVIAILGLGEEWEGDFVALSVYNVVTASSEIELGNVNVIRLPDESLAVFLVVPDGVITFDVDTLRITSNSGGEAYTIGEVVVATAQEWCIRRDWIESVASLTKQQVSVTGQPFNVRRNQQRKAAVTIAPVAFSKGYSIAQVQTLQKLQARLSQMQPVLVIPALRAPGLGVGAAVDTDVVYATALFGWCSNLGQISLVDNSNLAQLRLEFTEAPAGRVN
jgi:hypothetical protein